MLTTTVVGKKRTFIGIFFGLNFLLAVFFLDHYHYPNATSRALPLMGLLKQGTWRVDEYHRWTIDIAKIDNHYYTDKAPFSTIITMPFAYLWFHISTFNHQPEDRQIAALIRLGALVVGTGSFLGILWPLMMGLRQHYPMMIAAPLSMLMIYGSNLFAYAGAFWGHLLAGLLLTLSFQKLQQQKYSASGLMLGLATAAEYPVGFLFIFFTIAIFIKNKNPHFWRQIGLFLLGASLPIFFLGFYHWAFTGNPLHPLYFYVATEAFAQMRTNLGFSLPDPKICFQLIFGVFRGSLLYTPLLVLPILISGKKMMSLDFWQKNWLILAITSYFLLLNSAYFTWDGGWCHGPRHLIPALALLLVVLGNSMKLNPQQTTALIALSGLGILLNWMAKTVYPIYSSEFSFPYFQHIIPNFFQGKFLPTDIINQWFDTKIFLLSCLWPILLLVALRIVYWGGKKLDGTLPTLPS